MTKETKIQKTGTEEWGHDCNFCRYEDVEEILGFIGVWRRRRLKTKMV